MSIERLNLSPQNALEPALRLHPVKRIAFIATGDAARKQPRNQLAQLAGILFGQRSLICTRAEGDLL